jgi:dTDP-4-amino-4,6-dideoxygalactose transaminase
MKKIKLFDPVVGSKEEQAIKKTLKSHFWASGAGTGNVLEFEKEFKKYIGSDECVAVNSGTAALHLAISLIDVKNKEVILPSLSFVSSAHAVVYNGGIPIFADVDPITLCIEPQMIKKSLTKKTKVILPVHFGGMPCNLNEIQWLCEEFNVVLIEDAAHASGATYKNKKIGVCGTAVCFSFHPVKNLAMPTGGAITLNGKMSDKYRTILNTRRWCGISNRKDTTYDISELGWNYYMNEFSAAIGLEQLKKLDQMNARRRQIARRYSKEIALDKKMSFSENCSYHFYWIQVKNRINFMSKMNDSGVETGIHYKPIHKMGFYKDSIKLPNTEHIAKHIVSIPIHPNLTETDVDMIIKLINQFA